VYRRLLEPQWHNHEERILVLMKNNKSLGQHWLKNRTILDEIADLALPDEPQKPSGSPSPEAPALCLEIGPGLGTLTSSLLKRFQKVIAIEFDPELARKLPGSFPGKNLEVINQDILATDLSKLVGNEPYSVAGNIPYYITSPIIKKLLETSPKPQKISLLIQKEVAERIAADAGDQTLLSLTVQNLAEVELGPVVPAAEFTPPPKVDSQVLVLTPLSEFVMFSHDATHIKKEATRIPQTCLRSPPVSISRKSVFLARAKNLPPTSPRSISTSSIPPLPIFPKPIGIKFSSRIASILTLAPRILASGTGRLLPTSSLLDKPSR
jgi:16S rRNA (adenine1518-N6/adenine1519-N6)-dimethyltransferase